MEAYPSEPLSQFIARQKRANAPTPAVEADQTRPVTEAERRVAEAERRADAAAHRAEAAESRAVAAERRAAERLASQPPARQVQQTTPTVPAPTEHTSQEVPPMSPEKLALLRDVESASARLASARQGLEDAKHLYRAGMASDPVFAAHVVAGAINEWNRASTAFLSFKG